MVIDLARDKPGMLIEADTLAETEPDSKITSKAQEPGSAPVGAMVKAFQKGLHR